MDKEQRASKGTELLTKAYHGTAQEIDSEGYDALLTLMKPAMDLLKEYENSLKDENKTHDIGDRYEYRGANYETAKCRSETPWKKVAESATAMLDADGKAAIEAFKAAATYFSVKAKRVG